MLKRKNRITDPYLVALAVILAVNALLKWRFFTGLVQADDFSYGVYSYTMFRDIWPWSTDMDFRMLRLGLMLPVRMIFAVLPPTEFVAVLYPMAVSFATIVFTFLIGRRLYGPNAGILGAFVLATLPGDVIFGTMLLPDVVVPFYLSVAVWLFLRAEDRTGGASMVHYALTGLFVFAAFVSRENSYYFFLLFLPFAFNVDRWKRGLYMIGVGFTLPLIVVYGVYFMKTGDFLFNVHLATAARDSQIASGYIPKNEINMFTQFYYMFPVFRGDGRFLSGMFGMTFYIGLPCVVYTAVKSQRKGDRIGFIAPLWFILVYLFLEFGTLSFSQYQVMKKLPRFLLTLTPAMAISCGVVLNDALGLGAKVLRKANDIKIRWLTAIPGLVVLVAVLVTSYWAASLQDTSRDANMEQFRWAYREVFKDRLAKPLYGTGGWWANKLSFYFLPDVRFADINGRRSEMFHDLKEVKNPEELSGAYVLIDRKHFTGQNDLRIQHSYDDFDFYVLLPPKDWTLIGTGYGVDIYEVPENWIYSKPFGKMAIRYAFDEALQKNDPIRFFYCLHPSFVERLDRDTFYGLLSQLTGMRADEREVYLDQNLQYANHDGKWRVHFAEIK
ncbi:ArnT family glycosyltransferase [Candidatus Latescibacterota bacterium]